ncbi:MAG: general secretion pathway protein GspK [Bradyrhizobium sp.]|nr:general secretion pathway protein GspK [Bradyrhizobium sp.]
MSVRVALHRRPRGSRGFILVAVLWILLALAVLASVASSYVAQSALALAPFEGTLQTDALIAAGLDLTTYRLSMSTPNSRPTRGAFRFRLARTNVEVEFLSEAARIDLNSAPKVLIAGLFAALGAQSSDADGYAERVVAWRTQVKPGVADGEEALYRSAGLPYPPRRAPFNHIEELSLVAGLPPALVARAAPFVTIFSGRRDVNVLDAAPEVIAALPDMSPGRLNAFLAAREAGSPDPDFLARALGDKQSGATTLGSDAYRVRMRLVADSGRRQAAEVVILLLGPNDARPYGVLSWKTDSSAAGAVRSGGL